VRGVEQRVIRGEKRVAEAHDLGWMLQKCSEGRAPPTHVVLQESGPSRQRRFAILAPRAARSRLDATCARSKRENGGENAGVTAVDGDECLGHRLGGLLLHSRHCLVLVRSASRIER
jgi:hypothetical protein